MNPKHTHQDATVEFSDTACMQASTGEVYSAFQRNSLIARVTFDDGRVVCVSLPRGIRYRSGVSTHIETAYNAAKDLPDGGAAFL